MRRVMEERPLDPVSVYQLNALLSVIYFRLRPDDFREPPIAPACRQAGTRMMGGVGRDG